MNRTTTVTSGSLKVPGATLYYEVRGQGPLVVLVGAPMNATFFAPLADLLAADHTVLTTDPRGLNRSPLDDPDQDSTPEMRADDLSRLLTHLDAGPAAVFGSSGGAVSALALAVAHPGQVHTVIAHEPPLNRLLDDREERDAAVEDIIATYVSGDVAGAWAKFMVNANIVMPESEESGAPVAAPDEPDPQQVADERFWFLHEMRATTRWEPDIAALRAGPTRVVVGVGVESAGQLCDRTSAALAAALGTAPTAFPGGHIAFSDDPDGFAPRLRAVLHGG
ncbi:MULTISPECIES: alpha/beta fold hydrolase [Streptosporangium]|uniref:Pimeloyl-ACP methyl ester carboxylesterase n=1 Tax=Streptosporangium brasiliense TaxID=47480 RepID=A0ABT9QXS9_9ACTN|nr:alpha/beta hydrolase [Streptosporangium brasiliense]MDP9860995.1 pimeloyl-ACP methyl ester carboxylesterase [Streptosporangium brasiliense]